MFSPFQPQNPNLTKEIIMKPTTSRLPHLISILILAALACLTPTVPPPTPTVIASTPPSQPTATIIPENTPTVSPTPKWQNQIVWELPDGTSYQFDSISPEFTGKIEILEEKDVLLELPFVDGLEQPHHITFYHRGEENGRILGMILLGGYRENGQAYLLPSIVEILENGSTPPFPVLVTVDGNTLGIGQHKIPYFGDPNSVVVEILGHNCSAEFWSYFPPEQNSLTITFFSCDPFPHPTT